MKETVSHSSSQLCEHLAKKDGSGTRLGGRASC